MTRVNWSAGGTTGEIEQFITEENNNNDLTDGTFEALSDIVESAQEDFKDFIDADRDKKSL